MSMRDIRAVERSRRDGPLPQKDLPDVRDSKHSEGPTLFRDGAGGVRWGRVILVYVGAALAMPFVGVAVVLVLVGVVRGVGVLIGAE